jgi:DUF1680 family protein
MHLVYYKMKAHTFLCLAITLTQSIAISAPTPVKKTAESFPLGDVQLFDSPFKQNMERNAAYLLSLDPDRLLHNTRKYAGLTPKGELYGGWESQGIAGHTLGHYLTAISQQYAATGDKRFRDRIDYIIKEMAECQKAYGDGYIGALPPRELETMRGFKNGKVELASAFNFKSGAWVPWYTEHKVLAGLKDAWILGGNAQAKEVTLKLADWADNITKGLTPDQLQTMLQVEHGGMLEVLVEIYALTGEQRYLDTSRRFYHRAILDPLAAGRDELTGKHANTQIPKVIGEARTYEVTGDENGYKIAQFFWDTVVHRRSWVNGGNSDGEHFFPIGKAHEHLDPATAETCNTYNMLKLTEHLFEWQPSVDLADYYERALYNHILASQEPKEGMFTYFISLKPGLFKTYSTPTDSFWCCVGTGMENHTKYGEAIYFHTDDKLYVNLFIPSVLTWKDKGLVLEQHTNYPNEDFTELTIQSAPATPVALAVRCPAWITGPVTFQLNGQPLDVKSQPGQYAEISRAWKQGDRLRVVIPMGLRTEKLEGDPDKLAFLYGPLVLAGDFGAAPETKSFPYAKDQWDNFRAPTADVPVLIRAANSTDDTSLTASLKRIPGNELAFRTEGIGRPDEVTLRPFNRIFYQRYNVYWDVLSEQDWNKRKGEIQAEKERRQRDEARIVDEMNFGEQQPEVDHRLKSDRSQTGDFRDRKWRDANAGGYFEFQMKVLRNVPQLLRCTYWGDEAGRREFDILINGKLLATQKLDHNKPGQFFDVEYPIPAELISFNDHVTVRFQPRKGDNIAGGVFHCAILKAAP